jgi:hypothetical protein
VPLRWIGEDEGLRSCIDDHWRRLCFDRVLVIDELEAEQEGSVKVIVRAKLEDILGRGLLGRGVGGLLQQSMMWMRPMYAGTFGDLECGPYEGPGLLY